MKCSPLVVNTGMSLNISREKLAAAPPGDFYILLTFAVFEEFTKFIQ
jgi:hypothetical protein